MGSQSNRGSDHEPTDGEQKSESFVVDLHNFGNGFADNETAAPATTAINNSRITTRSLSRKVTGNRGGQFERENTAALFASSSPKAPQVGSSSGCGTPEKSGSTLASPPSAVSASTMGSATDSEPDRHQNPAAKPLPPQQHQITIKTGASINAAGPAPGDKRWGRRSLSFRRSSQSWFCDPRKVVVFFATLSIIGTVSLIYFTLTMSKSGGENDDLD